MSLMGNTTENAFVNHTLRNTAYTQPTIYVSLHTGDPGDTGASELAGGGYQRVAVSAWVTAASRATSNTNAILFPLMTAAVGTITYCGVWDAISGGNFLWATSALSASVATARGIVPVIAAGALDISMSGEISTYAANKWLDHVFGVASWTTPGTSVYVSLHTADPGLTGASEVSGNAYARVQVTAWDVPSNGATANTNNIVFATPTPSDWGTVTYYGIWDAASSGNFLISGNLDSSVVTSTSSAEQFATGALDVVAA